MRTLLLPLATLFAVAALPAQSPLTTTFAGGNAQSGNMFDLRAIIPVTITGFDVHVAAGTYNFEVFQLTAANTPYLPSVNTAANWTSIGTAIGVVGAGVGVPTPLPIPVSVPIAAGQTQAFYITVTNGGVVQYTGGTTTGALYTATSELEFYQGSGVAYPFTGNFNPRVFNGNIYYTSAGGFATKTLYGAGCYASPRMVSELFPGDTSQPDLVNTSWTLSYNPGLTGGTYTIVPGGPAYDAATPALNGTNLITLTPTSGSSGAGNWDDASITRILPFAFPYPNAASATTSDITVNSNAKIYLGLTTATTFEANGANSGFTPTSFQGTTGPGLPVLAGYKCDLDPNPGTGSGAIWYEDPSPNGGVRITWANIPNWQDTAYTGLPAQFCNIQMELLPNGLVFLSYGATLGNGGSANNEAIVGFSAGGGQPNVRIDWSTLSGYVSGDGRLAPSIDSSALPVFGTTPNLVVTDLGASTVVGGVILGLTGFDPGIPLLPVVGVPCNLHASLDLISAGLAVGGQYTFPFPIPNNPTLTGVAVSAQGFGLDPALVGPLPLNSLGALMSGGVRLTLGQ